MAARDAKTDLMASAPDDRSGHSRRKKRRRKERGWAELAAILGKSTISERIEAVSSSPLLTVCTQPINRFRSSKVEYRRLHFNSHDVSAVTGGSSDTAAWRLHPAQCQEAPGNNSFRDRLGNDAAVAGSARLCDGQPRCSAGTS